MRNAQDELEYLDKQLLRRSLRWNESTHASSLMLEGREVVNFASNDYLGLSKHPALKKAMIEGVEQWGVGSSASRLITGSTTAHQQLEEFLAEQKECEAALTFSTGYATAVGTLTALMGKGDTVILDKLAHASLIDGAHLSGATVRVYPHNGLAKLERLLESHQPTKDSRTLVITESVFSMDGDLAELEAVIALKDRYGAMLLVDEAHGLGIYGQKGMGLSEHLGCCDKIDIHMGTLSKAVGVSGGYIASSRAVIDLLVNKARSFIYSTAPSAAQAHTALASLKLIASDQGAALRNELWQNIHYLNDRLGTSSPSAIIPWHVGDTDKALHLSNDLLENGIIAPAIRYPTVPRGSARLRITVSSAHDRIEMQKMISLLTGVSDNS